MRVIEIFLIICNRKRLVRKFCCNDIIFRYIIGINILYIIFNKFYCWEIRFICYISIFINIICLNYIKFCLFES